MPSYLTEYVEDPKNPIINFMMAHEYREMGQLASAATHYLKAAKLLNQKF